MKKNVRRLTLLSAFMALSIVASQFLSITFIDRKFSFTFLVTATMCCLFSIPECIVVTVLIDLIGNTLFPSPYGFYPLFILPKVVSVIIYCGLFYKKKVNWQRSLIAALLVSLIPNMLINTWVISNMTHVPFAVQFMKRLPTSVINLVQRAIMLPLIMPKLAIVTRREFAKMGLTDSKASQ